MSLQHPFVTNAFYAHFRAPNADELHEYIETFKGVPGEFTWEEECIVETTYCSRSKDYDEISKLLAPSVKQFQSDLGVNFEYDVVDVWINKYQKNGFQEIHNHYTFHVDFSSVFIHNTGPDFGKFFLYNNQYPMISPNWRHMFNFPERWYPEVKPGDIIFFPSIMLHGAKIHKSDEVRKTLSANFKFPLKR